MGKSVNMEMEIKMYHHRFFQISILTCLAPAALLQQNLVYTAHKALCEPQYD